MPNILNGHTIYFFTGGTYNVYSPLVFQDKCIAIIGNGSTFVSQTNWNIFDATNRENIIISQVKIDGWITKSPIGINFGGNTKNSTIDGVVIYLSLIHISIKDICHINLWK